MEPVWQDITTEQQGELYQSSLITALLQGVYDGDTTYAEVMQHGDFGLGTFNALDGEMVAVHGEFYQLHSDGRATPVRPDQKTPFATVTHFVPQKSAEITNVIDKAHLLSFIKTAAETNLFTAIQIDGLFRELHTRTVAKQVAPYPTLTAATEGQIKNAFHMQRGTLAGFLSPQYAQGFQVGGFHLHFLSEDRRSGGHMLDFVAEQVTVRIASIHRLRVELPTSASFLKAAMDGEDISREVKKAEG